MQVDPTLMNVGDGGTVSREISAPNKVSTTMVGNPPQTLPPEFRGDVTLSHQNKTIAKNAKTIKTSLDTYNHSTGLSSLQQLSSAPVACSALIATDKRPDIPKTKADNTGVFSTQWSSGVKVDREESLSPCRSNMTSSNQSKTQMQSQSAPPGFHCSTIFKPTQSVAFLPSANFSSLCKITLPPALGQIAALREATASQFQKKIQPQSSGGTPLIRTYPYPFTAGRTSSSEKKLDACTSKQKSSHLSNKNSKSVEHRSLASVVASPAIALPVQHPSLTSLAPTHYTMSPTAAICCGSALANLASQGRLLNSIDKSNSIDMTTITLMNSSIPPTSDDQGTSCSNESRDVPLDLSAKSKRPKCIKDTSGSPAITFKDELNQNNFVNSKRTFSSTFSSPVQYPLLPHTHRNGSHQKQLRAPQNAHILDAKPCWSKSSSQDTIKNIPGTYVGVASPILASTLRGQDGKGTFADEFQSFAKQEFISIIDQGEHMSSEEHKPSSLKSVKNTSTKVPAKCPSKATLTVAQSSSANKQIPKSGSGKMAVPYPLTVVSPAWQQPEDFSQQPLTLQRRNSSASPKNKNPPALDESKNADYTLPTSEDKWQKIQSPLSNLASIVKQQSLDTAMFVSEGNAKSPPATSKKTNSLEKFKSNPNIQCKDNSESPPVWSVEKWPSTSQRDVSHVTKAVKRLEKLTNVTESVEDPREIPSSQEEHTTPLTKQTSLKSTIKSKVIENNSSAGNRMESKLAQVLEGEILKRDSRSSNILTPGKLEGTVASNVTGYCEEGGNSIENKSNGVNDMSPNKTKAAPIKQKTKKQSPKKILNSPVVSSKKATGNVKKQIQSDGIPIKASPSKKQSLLANQLSQHGDDLPVVKSSPKKVEQPCLKADGNYRLQKAKSPLKANKEAEATEQRVPRLRRGRRRTDESRLDLWGFATPSPPPTPPPPASPTPTPPQAARRPRGRPRSTPLPQRGAQGKGKNAGADTEGPVIRKRQRCKNKRYQTGDYITDKGKLDDGEHRHESVLHSQDHDSAADLQKSLNPPPSTREPRRLSLSRSVCYQEREESPEITDKPSGKRKFKSKHLCPTDEHKINPKRSLGKRSGSRVADEECSDAKKAASLPASPKSSPSALSNINGSTGKHSASESPSKRAVPPEVRRLIVNKNAGETLLQRAARLGYQDVVQYCLEKDQREVNRQDNAGYTALHEASSRGWVQIVQMLLKNGADVNCSAQDGTRPIHDAVASDNLAIVWLLLNHGADPTLATYSGQTPVKLAHSSSMKTFLSEYFTDLQGRSEHDPGLHWDFYSSTLFETEQEPCWDFLLSEQNQDLEQDMGVWTEKDHDKDCLVFEFSSEPLLPCYHVQVSLTQGFCNWFLLTDVLKRVKMSARIFRARFPHLEVVSLRHAELMKQVSVSQVSPALASRHKGQNKDTDEEGEEEEEEGHVDLVRCVPELQKLLGSSIYILQDNEEEDEPNEDKFINTGKLRSR